MIQKISNWEINFIGRDLYNGVDHNIRKLSVKLYNRVNNICSVYDRLEVIWNEISDDLRRTALNGRRKR